MKRFSIHFTFLILLLFTSISGQTNSKTFLASKVFKEMKTRVFRVKTALGEDAPKSSYGSGFVVSKDGLIMTNYHVVARSLKRFEKYKIFVVINKKSYLASIYKIDINNDLALLKIEKKFKDVVKLRKSKIKMGEKIFSMGIPEDLGMSIIEGIYNGVKKNGLYENIHISTPLNSGMSGGPVFDSMGRLVGVNVSVLLSAQNISFAVTLKSVKQILKRNRDDKVKINLAEQKPEIVDNEIRRQLLIAQDALMEDFTNSSKKLKSEGKWQYIVPSKELKCWQVDLSDRKHNRYKGKNETCYVPNSSYIMSGTYSGSYEMEFSVLESVKLNKIKFYDYLNKRYNGSQYYRSLYINYSRKNNYTKYSCNESFIVNNAKIPLKVNYCLRGYLDYKNIFDADIKFLTILKEKDALQFDATLRGFTKEKIDKFLKIVINGIRYNKDASTKNPKK